MSEKTIPEHLQNRVKEHGTKLLYQRRDGWSWKQITWLDFDRKVKNIAAFLHDLGLSPGSPALTLRARTGGDGRLHVLPRDRRGDDAL